MKERGVEKEDRKEDVIWENENRERLSVFCRVLVDKKTFLVWLCETIST